MTVPRNQTLTIEPGVLVIFTQKGLNLNVRGTLLVEGTDAAKVTFLPTADALTWAGIVVDTGGDVSLAYVEGTKVATLVYCHAGANSSSDSTSPFSAWEST